MKSNDLTHEDVVLVERDHGTIKSTTVAVVLSIWDADELARRQQNPGFQPGDYKPWVLVRSVTAPQDEFDLYDSDVVAVHKVEMEKGEKVEL